MMAKTAIMQANATSAMNVSAMPDSIPHRCGRSRFLRAPFQISKRAAGKAAELSRSGVEFRGVIGAPRFERREPPAETGKLIRRQLSNSFGDFLDLHVIKYSTAEAGWSLCTAVS